MTTEKRFDLLADLGIYMNQNSTEWMDARDRAAGANAWFTPDHISLAIYNIAGQFLKRDKLQQWIASYTLPKQPKTIGIVMAGNIPLVGFHDFLCGFLSGHRLLLKLSSKY